MRYLIAATQRTGGLMLCDLLAQAGAGLPGEWLHVPPRPGIQRRVVEEGPVCGIKVQYDEIDRADEWGPYDRIIHLVRRDILAQARSWALAEATDQWRLLPGETRAVAEPPAGEVERIAQVIPEQNREWRRWIAASGVPAITVTYEQLVRDAEATVGRILAHLGLDPRPVPLLPASLRQAA